MKTCPVCLANCDDNAAQCPICNTSLMGVASSSASNGSGRVCPVCGTPAFGDAAFCENCGSPVPQAKKESNNKNIIIIVVVCILAVAIIVGALLIGMSLSGKDSADDDSKSGGNSVVDEETTTEKTEPTTAAPVTTTAAAPDLPDSRDQTPINPTTTQASAYINTDYVVATYNEFYTSYLEAINEMNAGYLSHCTSSVKTQMVNRFPANNKSYFELDRLEYDMYSYTNPDPYSASFYVRCVSTMYDRATLTEKSNNNYAIWQVTVTQYSNGEMLVSSMTRNDKYSMSSNIHYEYFDAYILRTY